MDKIAASQQLEAVHGKSFPEVNPYGSYGSPYVLDFINGVEGVEHSVLFLARKKNESYTKSSSNSVIDLVHHYDYFLIFAVRTEGTDSFEVKNIIEEVGLMGMSLYYGKMDISTKEFSYINSNRKIVGSEFDHRKLSAAVLISGDSSTTILFYYDGSWIEYVEIDW